MSNRQRHALFAVATVALLAACARTSDDDGAVPEATPSAVAAAVRVQSVARALAHLDANALAVPHDQDHTFAARDVIVDSSGEEHVRFDRRYRGLRVLGGDVVVHAQGDGAFKGVSLAFANPIQVDVTPTVSAEAAVTRARQQLLGSVTAVGAPELVVYAGEGAASLAYEVIVSGTLEGGAPSELHVVVDARGGEALDSWDGIETVTGTGTGFFDGTVALETTLSGSTYKLTDPTRGGGSTVDMNNGTTGSGVLFADSDNSWGNGALTDRATIAVDAQYGGGATWDYYKLVHGRNGIKNNGAGATSRVHYNTNYNNAYWSDSCFCMTYGDGDGTTFSPFTAIDVTGHEMTHGVTSATAGLAYRGESGGLNEATSDIMGTMVEYYANLATDAPDYLIGEKLYKSNPSGTKALRYMYKPSLDGKSPDCYSSAVKRLDVHYSSAIANHFFYLLAEGSSPSTGPASPTCNGSSVGGIGRSAAARIWYRALTVYMTSRTAYADARKATVSAATDLFGAGSAQASAVAAAWSAVSVN